MALLLMLFAAPGAARAQVLGDLRRTPVVEAVERATPAVVTVRVEVQAASPFLMFGPELRASEGSGVIVDASGVVLTNAHVVDGARRIELHLSDGRKLAAELVAADPDIDLAVLRVPGARGLPTLPLGDSDRLLLGEPAIAIGNPYGLGLTVSTGVIASVARDVNVGGGPRQTYIQTDAAINPGNSGGALVNVYGELVGINTFIHAGGEGIGFAIPVNRARKIAEDLLTYGQVQVPWLGLGVIERARRGAPAEGLVVVRVHGGGPAALAGLAGGDVLTSFDGHALASRADLNARLAERRPGDRVRLGLLRGGVQREITLVSGRPPADLGEGSLAAALGVDARGIEGGVVVTAADPSGTFAKAGLRAGDVVVAVDGQKVRTVDELQAAVGRAWARHRGSAWLTVVRGQVQGNVQILL